VARILLTTFGSLGDLHPYLAIGIALRRRGHDVTVATHGDYRDRTLAAGLAFAPVRPRFSDLGAIDALMRDAMDERRGSEVVLRRMVLPHLRDARDDLLVAAREADLLVDHMLALAGPLVAERLGIPRVSTVLQPFAMFSAHDPPVTPAVPALMLMRRLGPWAWRGFWALGRTVTRSDLEVAFLAFLDPHSLPRPRTNHRIELVSGEEPWGRRRLAGPPPHRRARQLRHPHHPPKLRGGPCARPRAHRRGVARRADHVAPAARPPPRARRRARRAPRPAADPTLKESAHRPMTGPAPMDGCAEQPRDGRLYEPLP